MKQLIWMCGGAMLITGCATVSPPRPATDVGDRHTQPQMTAQYLRDRQAILAMTGEYHVSFNFHETAALAPGYELAQPQPSQATEFVTVLEDSTDRIVLQHILVLGEDQHVVKHWRQDWTWQPTEVFQYRGDNRWEVVELDSAQVQGAWSQSVWQVDDSPRYAAVGRWEHLDSQSVWTSETTWRPLPRREHTTRDDYDVMVAVNRHVITPWGWLHEQDNTKLVTRDGQNKLLAREYGANEYRRITDYDFTAGWEYWDRTQDYWAEVRRVFDQWFAETGRVELLAEVNDETLWQRLFRLAEESPEPALVGPALSEFRVQ